MFSRLWWHQLRVVGEQRLKQTYRQPLLTLILIFLPVLVLSPMTLLRWNMHREFWSACHYRSVALPSAGTARFLQSFMCGFDLHCHSESEREIDPTAYYDRSIVPQWWNALLPALTNQTKVWTLASAVADLQLFLTISERLQLTTTTSNEDESERRRVEALKLNVTAWLDETLERAHVLASGRNIIGAPAIRFGSPEDRQFDIEHVAQKADQLFQSVSRTVKQMSSFQRLNESYQKAKQQPDDGNDSGGGGGGTFSNAELGFVNTLLNNAEKYFQKVPNNNNTDAAVGGDEHKANSTHFRLFVQAAVKSLAQHGLLDVTSVDAFFAKLDDSWLLIQNVSLTTITYARQGVQRYQRIVNNNAQSQSAAMHIFMKNALCGENLDHYLPPPPPTYSSAEISPIAIETTSKPSLQRQQKNFTAENQVKQRQRREAVDINETAAVENQTTTGAPSTPSVHAREPVVVVVPPPPPPPPSPPHAAAVDSQTTSLLETLSRTRLDAPVIKMLFKLIVGKENDAQFFAESLSKIETSLERAMNRSAASSAAEWSLTAAHVCPLFENEVNKILKTNVVLSMIKPLAYGKVLYYTDGDGDELADEIIERTYGRFRPVSISFGYIIQFLNFISNVGRAREHYLSPQTDRVLSKLIFKALQQSSAVSSKITSPASRIRAQKSSTVEQQNSSEENSPTLFSKLLPILMFPELTQQLGALARALLQLQQIIFTECLSWQSNIERATSLEQFARRARELEDAKKLLGGVVFLPPTAGDDTTIRYEIHMHSSRMSDTRRAEPELDVMRGGMPPLYYLRYLLGFVPLQDAIDRSIIEALNERRRKAGVLSSRMLWPAQSNKSNVTNEPLEAPTNSTNLLSNFTWLEPLSSSTTTKSDEIFYPAEPSNSAESRSLEQQQNQPLPMLFAHKMPVPCFVMDYLVMVLLALKPFLIIVAICIGSGIMAYELVAERERDTDRMMRLHGIRLGVRSTVWFIRWFIIWTLVAVLVVLYEYYGDLIIYSNHWLQFLFLLATLVSNMTFTFMISSFCDRPLVASIIVMAWIFFSGIPGKYLGVIELRLSDAALVPYMMIHMITACFLIVYTMFMEQLMTGITFENWNRGMQMYGTFTPRELFVILLLDMALYFVIGIVVRSYRECRRRRGRGSFSLGGWCCCCCRNRQRDEEARDKNHVYALHYDSKQQRTVNFHNNNSVEPITIAAAAAAAATAAANENHQQHEKNNNNNCVQLCRVTKIYNQRNSCLALISNIFSKKKKKNAQQQIFPAQQRCSAAEEEQAEISNNAAPQQNVDLATHFNGIRNVNAILCDNEITCFLGHNGAGKSTAMAVMCGFERPTSGNVRVFGHENIYNQHVRSLIGYCPQSNILFHQMTVREHLRFYAGLKGFGGEKLDTYVVDAMQRTELTPFADQYASTLSGGYKRRLMLAIAFAYGNRLIVLDEPSSGVDPAARRQFWHMIVRQRRPGCVIVVSTHHLNEAHYLADKLAIMHQGRLVAFDPLNSIIERYSAGELAFCRPPPQQPESIYDQEADCCSNKPTWRIALSWTILSHINNGNSLPQQNQRTNNGSRSSNEEEEENEEDDDDPIAQRNLLQEHVRFKLSAIVCGVFPSAILLPPQFLSDGGGSVHHHHHADADDGDRVFLPIKLLHSTDPSVSTSSSRGNVIIDECVYEMREYFCVNKKRQLLEQLLALQQQDDQQQFSFIDIDIEQPSLHDLFLDMNQVEQQQSTRAPSSISFHRQQSAAVSNIRQPRPRFADAKNSQRMISMDSMGGASDVHTPTGASAAEEDTRHNKTRSVSTRILLGCTRYVPTRPLRQSIGLIWKRFVHHIRAYQFTLAVLLVPLVSILATALFLTSVRKPLGNVDKLELDPNQLYWGFPVFHALQPTNEGTETYGRDVVRILTTDPTLNHIDPKLCFRCNEARSRETRRIYSELSRKGTGKSYANGSCLPDESLTLPNSTTYVVDSATGIPLVHVDVSQVYGSEDIEYIRPRNTVIKKIFGGYSFRNPAPSTQQQQQQSAASATVPTSSLPPAVTVWYSIRGEHSLPQYLSQLNNALLKSQVGDARWHIRAYAAPLNLTRDEQAGEDNTQVTLVASALLVITFAATLLPTSTVVYVIRERMRGERRVQLLSSVAHSTYWLSSFLFDLLVLHVLLIGGIAIIFISIQNSVYSYADGYYHTILLLLFVYSASMIAMAYMLSLLFSEHNFAFTVLAALACSFGFVAAMFVNPSNFFSWLANIENLIKVEDDRVFMWLPNYCLAQSLINMQTAKFRAHSLKQFVCDKLSFGAAAAHATETVAGNNNHTSATSQEQWSDECARSLIINPLEWTVTGRYLTAMAISGAVYFAILLCIEYLRESAGVFSGAVRWRRSREVQNNNGVNVGEQHRGVVAELRHVSYTYSTFSYLRELVASTFGRLLHNNEVSKTNNVAGRSSERQVGALQAFNMSDVSPAPSSAKSHRQQIVAVPAASSTATTTLAATAGSLNMSDATRDGIRNVSLSVKAGECYGLFGFNGAGKTTIFRCLTNETVPCEGSIQYFFKNYRRFPCTTTNVQSTQKYDSARLIGYCPQTDPLDPSCTPEETLAFYAVMKNIRTRDVWSNVENCLDEFALQSNAHKCCAHLSGGNKRKLSAAIALLKRPRLVLMDEPTSGVDPAAQQLLGRALQAAMRDPESRSAVLLTSHKMADATLLCSRLAIVRRGHLLMEDAMHSVVKQFSRKFLVLEVYYENNNHKDSKEKQRRRAHPQQQTSFGGLSTSNSDSDVSGGSSSTEAEQYQNNVNLLRIENLVHRLEAVGLRAIARRVSDRVLEFVILNDATGSVEDGDRVKVYMAMIGSVAKQDVQSIEEEESDLTARQTTATEWRRDIYDFNVKNSSVEEVFASLSHPLPDARVDMLQP